MNRKTVFAALAAFAFAGFGLGDTTKIATREWVERRLAALSSAASAAKPQSISFSCVVDGTNYEFSVKLSQPTNEALRVQSSTNPNLPAGVVFAKTAAGLYQNVTNTICDAVSTSLLSAGTNDFLIANFAVSGVAYRGRRDCRGWYRCVAYQDAANQSEIMLAECRVSDRTLRKVLTPLPRVSLFGLFCGSAFAGWFPGGWEYVGQHMEGEDVFDDYEQHYYLLLSASPSIESVDVKIGNAVRTLDVDVPMAEGFYDGMDFCDFSVQSFDGNQLIEGFIERVGDYVIENDLLPEGLWNKIVRAQGKSIRNQASLAFVELLTDLISGAPEKCPDKESIKVGDEDEQEQDPPPAPPSGCPHNRCAAGSCCGNWICAQCFLPIANGPTAHSWEDRDGHCARCRNSFGGIQCPAASDIASDHYFAKSESPEPAGCRCRNGRLWPHQGLSDSPAWSSDETGHWHARSCSVCGYESQGGFGEHKYELPPYTFETTETACNIAAKCICGRSGVFEYGTHERGEADHVETIESDENHLVWYSCARCGKTWRSLSREESHTPETSDGPLVFDDEHHWQNVVCTTEGCNWSAKGEESNHSPGEETGEYQDNVTNHIALTKCADCDFQPVLGRQGEHGDWKWTLSDQRQVSDTMKCGMCGHEDLAPHHWIYNENIHFCDNGGGVHLYGFHEGDPCYCGYGSSGDLVKQECGCGCYRLSRRDANGEDIPGSATTHCREGWDLDEEACSCAACSSGDEDFCLCCCMVWNSGKWKVGICIPRITSEHRRTYWQGMLDLGIVDGDDPVYDIGDGALEDAFRDCTGLETVRFNFATNVGVAAFRNAFAGCTALASVQFDALGMIGAAAFDGAFRGCTSLKGVAFPSATNICEDSFSRCDCFLSFPRLETVPEYAFTGFSGMIDLPAATDIGAMAFLSSSITNLAIGSFTTNAAAAQLAKWCIPTGCHVVCSDGILIAPAASAALPADFYVAAHGGSDENDGLTPSTAFKTIDRATAAAADGQTVGVLPGIYPYPSFYATNTSLSRQTLQGDAPYSVSLVAALGSGTVVIDAALSENAQLVGNAENLPLFDNLTFRGCRQIGHLFKSCSYMLAHFKNCTFDNIVTTNGHYAATWFGCLLENCRASDMHIVGIGGSTSYASDNPAVFASCTVSNCVVSLTNAVPTADSRLILGAGVRYEDCRIEWNGSILSLDAYPFTADGFFRCTLLGDPLANPAGWTEISSMSTKFYGCLIGIDNFATGSGHVATDCTITTRANAASIAAGGGS